MIQKTLLLVVFFSVVNLSASEPMSLQSYLEAECNIVDPAATGLVSEDLVKVKACPEKSNLFCADGMEQAGSLLKSEIQKSNIYTNYIDSASKIKHIVEILGNQYMVVRGGDLVPLVDQFWYEKEKEIKLELSADAVSYKLVGDGSELSLTVGFDAETETCDFSQPQIKAINNNL